MHKQENNFAFIDSQNLNLGIRALGWQLDFYKFHTYLRHKFNVVKAYLFIGYLPHNRKLYSKLSAAGYDLIFKRFTTQNGKPKGNIDAELVMHTMEELCKKNFDQAVIISGDGDFSCLINLLIARNKLKRLILPNR